MKKPMVLVLLSLSWSPAIATPSPEAQDRERIVAQDSDSLKKIDTQLADFSRLLAAGKVNTMTLQQQISSAEDDVAKRDSYAQSLLPKKAALDSLVDAHNARCHGSSTDAGLVAGCNAEAADLQGKEADMQSQGDAALASLNTATTNLQSLKDQQDANDQAVSHYESSIESLEAAEKRIEDELDGINQQIAACEAAFKEPNLDKMHEECGKEWDGNPVHTEHTPDVPEMH